MALGVTVHGMGELFPRFRELALSVQSRYEFLGADNGSPAILCISAAVRPQWFMVDRVAGVDVSTWQMAGICAYSGIEPALFLLLGAVLGLAQWRILLLNPLLLSEDLQHGRQAQCLFAQTRTKQEVALLLEYPRVCHGCIEFCRCLGAEQEIRAVQETVTYAQNQTGSHSPNAPS